MPPRRTSAVPPPAAPAPWTSRHTIAVVLLTAAAALLRWVLPGHAPPGLEQDEAINAWNAWCLLRTGRDMSGHAWPVFDAHAIGDNRTTLYFYLLLPFQALGGLSVATTRLPAQLTGVLCVPLMAQLGRRVGGPMVGCLAALLIAFDPWHLFVTRWGIEGSVCPFLGLLFVVLLIEAGAPIVDPPSPPRPAWAFAAGLAAGIACYGYWPMRLWVPAVLLLVLVACLRPARRVANLRMGRATLIAGGLPFALTFGPLAWRHAVDPAIAQRATMTRLWDPGAPPLQIAQRVLARFAEHYGPRFLFERADPFELFAPKLQGQLPWVLMPLLAIGAIAALARARRSASARLVVLLLLAYPAGDLVARYDGPHALRSAVGLPALLLAAAYGAPMAWQWLAPRGHRAARLATAALAATFVVTEARYLAWYFGDFDRQPVVYHGYATDVVDACTWMRPRLSRWNAVYVTSLGTNQPFAPALVALRWDPRRWFDEPRIVGRNPDGWDVTTRFGPIRFLYGQIWRPEIEALQADRRAERVLFVVRPGELGLHDPIHVVRRPDGQETLWLIEVVI